MRHYRELSEILETMAAAEGIAGLREPLQALTLAMESVYVNFGAGQLPEVARAHCPMVEGGVEIDGQPIGTWLQRSGRLANPYWGAIMLRCGDFHGSLGGTQTTE